MSGVSQGTSPSNTGLESCPPKEEIFRREEDSEAQVAKEIGSRLDREELESRENSSGARFQSEGGSEGSRIASKSAKLDSAGYDVRDSRDSDRLVDKRECGTSEESGIKKARTQES